MLGSLSSRGLTGLALLLAVGCRPAPAEGAPGDGSAAPPLAAADIASIRGTDSAFAAAANAGDATATAATYLPDAHLLPPNSAPVEGREAIERFWKGFYDAYRVTISLGTDEIEGRGDLAYARGHFTLDAAPKSGGGAPLHDEGKFVEVLRRRSDGSWLYVVDIYNSNLAGK